MGWQQHDSAGVAAIVADEFQGWTFRGERLDKSGLLRRVARAGEGESRVEDPIVRVFGETAVYTARIVDVGTGPTGEHVSLTTCVTDVFVPLRGKWQMVASHEMLLEK